MPCLHVQLSLQNYRMPLSSTAARPLVWVCVCLFFSPLLPFFLFFSFFFFFFFFFFFSFRSFFFADKDVARTDREHPFFAGDGNPNLPQLRRILLCYVAHDPDLGF